MPYARFQVLQVRMSTMCPLFHSIFCLAVATLIQYAPRGYKDRFVSAPASRLPPPPPPFRHMHTIALVDYEKPQTALAVWGTKARKLVVP